jgi:hypothetical protein
MDSNNGGIPLALIQTPIVQDCVSTLLSKLCERHQVLDRAHAQLQLQHQVDIAMHNQMHENYKMEVQDHQVLWKKYEAEVAAHANSQAQFTDISIVLTKLLRIVDNLYAQIPSTSTQGNDIPPGFNLSAVKFYLQNMDSQLLTLHPPLHQMSPTTTHFQRMIKLAQVVVQDGQQRVE